MMAKGNLMRQVARRHKIKWNLCQMEVDNFT
jgi:hypothetical protein